MGKYRVPRLPPLSCLTCARSSLAPHLHEQFVGSQHKGVAGCKDNHAHKWWPPNHLDPDGQVTEKGLGSIEARDYIPEIVDDE